MKSEPGVLADNSGPSVPDQHIKLYETYVENLNQIGTRHETLRQFYLTLMSALMALFATSGEDALFRTTSGGRAAINAAGLVVAVAWALHMRRFSVIFVVKKIVLRNCEKELKLPFKFFEQEFEEFKSIKNSARAGTRWIRFARLTVIDQMVALIFIIFFAFMLVWNLRAPDMPSIIGPVIRGL